ncbi:TonB-dependent siderophore receptor [Cellvibrio mixtus]|uniref:TonB-dependent siderophore receptor n=1 Tax=Cellvibrio mixtus TaxID=39650 RepID=A0A266Q6T4_9GAMM|nr:TonB-dependent receptor [Cellvibrio mixtus]OZY85594.1 TonB-dependent siderophore receptor [Cellvibrio mixtus]
MPQFSFIHFSLTPLTRILRATALGVGLGLACGSTAVAQVSPSEPTSVQKSYHIPAGTLSQSLNHFASEAGITLSFTPELVEGKQAQELNGSFAPYSGLQKLLQGSGLETVIKSDGSFSLKLAVPVAQLKTVKVTAAAESDTSYSYATKTASIVRGAESLKEIPQSVTVVTRKLIEDQNLTMMSDALAKAPGIVATTDGMGNPEFRSRGFVIDNYQVDSLGTSYTSTYRPDFDLAIYDRVEILRGADGLFSAAGEPGGTINLARKRPTDYLSSSVSLAYGSWDNARIEGDIGGAIAFDGKLRGRVVGVWQDREFFYRPADEQKQVIYGILEFDLTDSTTISGGASDQKVEGVTWMKGLPTFDDSSQLGLPRKVALNLDWATRDTTVKETFLTIDHEFNDNWSAKLSGMKQRYDFDYIQLSLQGPVDKATGLFGELGAFSEDDGNHSEGVDLSITGRFQAWGYLHKLVAGIDSRSSHGKEMRNNFEVDFPNGEVGIDDFPGLELPAPTVGGYNHGWPAWGAEQKGGYARLNLQVSDSAHVILGGRYANYRDYSSYELFDGAGNLIASEKNGWREDGIFTPYAAFTYDLTPAWTTYVSFTEVYKPQNSFAGPAEDPTKLDPITGRNYELGAKGSVLDGALNLSVALYSIERDGEAIQDMRYGEGSNFWLPLGEIVSEGVDLEVSGELAPGWEIFAGYTYNRNENEQSDVVYSELTPKHIFKLWSDYTLPGDLSQWTFGGGVTAKSEHANSGTYWVMTDAGWTQPPFEIKQGGYAVWDARVNYQMSDSWNLSLNLNNIFDENYYATLGRPSDGNWYGTPRNATITLRGQF